MTCFSKPMSTSPDASHRADDQLVTHLSHWLTRQLGNDELLVELGTAVPGERGQLEVLVRETVETLVYGD